MNDRGMIKWQPFNSVIPSSYIIKCLEEEKKRISMPILSEDELNDLNNQIITAYYQKEPITIYYYYKKKFFKITDIITKISSSNKLIYLEKGLKLSPNQIVKIKPFS